MIDAVPAGLILVAVVYGVTISLLISIAFLAWLLYREFRQEDKTDDDGTAAQRID